MQMAIVIDDLGKSYQLNRTINARASLRDLLRPGPRDAKAASGRYEDFWALKHVTFSVRKGSRVGIIGRNGAGKSTLLKILSRITPPTAGQAKILGRVASLLEVGTGFHPDLTGRENIFLNGAILGMTKQEIRAKFDSIVSFAGVERFLETPVKRYSSGMYVRLAFSVAAHLTPEILIVDEVLAVGDAEFQKKCLGVMKDVSSSEGRTILFVSHNMAAIQALCDFVVYLENGRVVEAGPTTDVLSSYLGRGGSGESVQGTIDGPDFAFLGMAVSAPDGSSLTAFAPALISVTFRANRAIADAGAHVLIEDLNGAPVLGLESKDFLENVRANANETISASFRISELPLTPGPFRMRIWLRSHGDHLHWEVPRTFDIAVEQTAVYGVRRIDRNVHGVVAVRAQATVNVTAI